MMARPAAGPSRIATATARFSSTTGDGTKRIRTSYSPTISFQSVAAARGRSAWTARDRRLDRVGPVRPDDSACSTRRTPSAI